MHVTLIHNTDSAKILYTVSIYNLNPNEKKKEVVDNEQTHRDGFDNLRAFETFRGSLSTVVEQQAE